MAKKSQNPADAHRKAQRAKEIKKNKEDRKKVREVITLKKDTGGLEAEVRRLSESERKKTLTAAEKERLAALRSEVERIKKTKEDYLEKHPEHRKFVYPNEEARLKAEQEKEDNKGEGSSSGGRGGPLYGKDGRLRNPERSVYYDPVLNPYGAPPPGMPYMERPPSPSPLPVGLQGGEEPPSESEEEEESSDDDDDELVMPEGPPPPKVVAGEEVSSEEESDDEIVFPEGPPPPKPTVDPPLPPGPPPLPHQQSLYPNFPPPGFNPSIPPPGYNPNFPPPNNNNFRPPFNGGQGRPPYRPNFQNQAPPPNFFPQNGGPPQHQQQFRPPPGGPRGGFRPPPTITQDPLSNVPHQTYQGHQLARRMGPPPSASLPPNPNSLPVRPPSASTSSVSSGPQPPSGPSNTTSISAGPQLRDFRKESAAFVPTSVKRKQLASSASASAAALKAQGAINSAPGKDKEAGGGEERRVQEIGDVVPKKQKVEVKQSALMGSLMGVLGKAGLTGPAGGAGGGVPGEKKKKEDKDGYGGFLEGLGGL